jgi:hypothetical protein
VSVLVGVTGMRHVRQLRRHGVKAWAIAERRPDGGATLRYTLPGGRVLAKFIAARTAALRPGQGLLIWYDPADRRTSSSTAATAGRRTWCS